MERHIEKLSQFDHFLLQRSLKFYKKDKDRKSLVIMSRENHDKVLARLESFKSQAHEADRFTHGGCFFKVIFGESNICVQDGIYFDLLHSFEDPTASRGQLFDLGLIELFNKDKTDLGGNKRSRSLRRP